MNKKVLVIKSSPRKNGNTDILSDAFIKGALENKNEVKEVRLQGKQIHGCLGCEVCRSHRGKCIQKDDMQDIYDQILDADIIVLSSPVYFYSWTSQIKAVLDRTFAIEPMLQNKTFYLISSGAAPDQTYMQILLDSFKKYVLCFRAGGNTIGGYVFGYHNLDKKDILKSNNCQEAYELGRLI